VLAWQWQLYMLPFYSYILGIVVSSVFVRFPQKKIFSLLSAFNMACETMKWSGAMLFTGSFQRCILYIEFWMDDLICIIFISIVFIHFNIKFYLTAFSALISLIDRIESNESLQKLFFCHVVSILKWLDFSHIC